MTTHEQQRTLHTSSRSEKPQVLMEVVHTERISEHFHRITLGGPGFADFADKAATDKYIKLLLPPNPNLGLVPPFDLGELRKSLPKDQLPVRRTYTAHSVDHQAQTLIVDFVLHGEAGVAGPWAENARVGDLVSFGGPGGQYHPRDDVNWHLLAGDEAALPAIAAALQAMDDNATGVAYIEVAAPADEWKLTAPPGIDIVWLHRGGEFTPQTTQLEQAVHNLDWRDGRVQTFIHGEREVIKALRRFLTDERGVDRSELSLSPYWAYSRAEDKFQEEKKQPIGQIFPNAQATVD